MWLIRHKCSVSSHWQLLAYVTHQNMGSCSLRQTSSCPQQFFVIRLFVWCNVPWYADLVNKISPSFTTSNQVFTCVPYNSRRVIMKFLILKPFVLDHFYVQSFLYNRQAGLWMWYFTIHVLSSCMSSFWGTRSPWEAPSQYRNTWQERWVSWEEKKKN
jgi:hypothetical protein